MSNVTIEVEGDERLLLVLDHIEHWSSREGKELLNWLASNATFWMRIYAPVGETGALVRHIDRTGVYWHPGGAGGGGSYEAIAGVPPIPQTGGSSLYPLDVEKGTKNEGRGYIYPRLDRAPASIVASRRPRQRHGGGVLTFQKQGEPRKFRYRVRGQKPQPFVFKAFHQVSIYTRSRLLTLGREVVRL